MASRTIASLAGLIYSEAITIKLKTFCFFAVAYYFFVWTSRLWDLFRNIMSLMRSFFMSIQLDILLFCPLLALFLRFNLWRFFLRLFLFNSLSLLRWLRFWLSLTFWRHLFFWRFLPNYFVLYSSKLLLYVLTIRTI